MQPVGGAAGEAAARILKALRSGDTIRLRLELDYASGACRAPLADSLTSERAELLEGVVWGIREGLDQGTAPRLFEPQAALLGHLAGFC